MQFNPKNLEEQPRVKEGRYQFKVANACEKVSKTSGNPMIEIELSVTVGHMRTIKVFDYLLGIDSCLFKVKQFCESVGIDFNDGNIEVDDVLGVNGEALFKYELSSNGREYLKVIRYISRDTPPADDEPKSQIRGEDIPF